MLSINIYRVSIYDIINGVPVPVDFATYCVLDHLPNQGRPVQSLVVPGRLVLHRACLLCPQSPGLHLCANGHAHAHLSMHLWTKAWWTLFCVSIEFQQHFGSDSNVDSFQFQDAAITSFSYHRKAYAHMKCGWPLYSLDWALFMGQVLVNRAIHLQDFCSRDVNRHSDLIGDTVASFLCFAIMVEKSVHVVQARSTDCLHLLLGRLLLAHES